jgi:hypothetical protein
MMAPAALAGKTQTLHPALHADVLLLVNLVERLFADTRHRIRRGISTTSRNSKPQSTNGLSIKTEIRNRSHGPPLPKPFSSSTAEPKKFSPKRDVNE